MNKTMILRAFFAITLSFTFAQRSTLACTCSFGPLSTESIQSAPNIFVFRIMSATVANENIQNPSLQEVEAKIKVIDRIHGANHSYNALHFSTSWCCGSRLDVGRYYIAFISEKGPNFLAHNGNIIEISEGYYPNSTAALDAKGKILKILSKKAKLEDVFTRETLDRVEQSPVLPPCIKNKRK